ATLDANCEPLLAVEAVDALVVDPDALSQKEAAEGPVPRARPRCGQSLHSRDELDRRVLRRLVSLGGPRHAERATGAPLTKSEDGLDVADGLAAQRGLHHFFESTSRSASLWSICSESIFLSRRFSSSSSRSFRASLASIPAYFSRYR